MSSGGDNKVIWKVPKVNKVEAVKAPIPTAQGLKAGELTDWIQWTYFTTGTRSVNVRKALKRLPASGDISSVIGFWLEFGPLVGKYTPTWCRWCRVHIDAGRLKQIPDTETHPQCSGCQLARGTHAVPLETVNRAAELLRVLSSKRWDEKQGTEIGHTIHFLQELYEYMGDHWRKHAAPLGKIPVSVESGHFLRLLPGDVQPWWKNYCLWLIPGDRHSETEPRFQQPAFKMQAGLRFSPEALTVAIPYLFPVLLYEGALPIEPRPCDCGCGKPAQPGSRYADKERCRKNVWWRENRAK